MNRWLAGICLAAVTAAAPARAEIVYGESRKTNALEIKLGGYKPLMQGNGLEFYNELFGAGAMLLFELEYDWQFFQKYGSLAVGFSAGYAEKYGPTLLAADTSTEAEERASVKVVPLKLMAVYRGDYAALHWNIPVVPYVKGGLVLVPWWFGKGASTVEFSEDGTRWAGGKWGFGVTAGVSILLDFLDPRLARDFDTDLGVNHSYVFAEYNYINANSFGQPGLDFSSRYWMFGLALEF